jgi:hypothetical protein
MTIDEQHKHLRVTHSDGKFAVARLKNDDHNLAEDEPVFVFRGADKHMGDVLHFYAKRCEEEGSPPEHVAGAREARQQTVAWQQANHDKVKTPD